MLSTNLHRRHLDASQRAMVAARAKGLFEDEAAARRKAAQNNNAARAVPPNLGELGSRGEAADHAAKLVNVGRGTVEAAATVLEQGAPELVAAVDRGEVAVSAAAEVARLPPEEQRAAVAEGTVPAKAKALREGRKAAKQSAADDLRQRLEAAPASSDRQRPGSRRGALVPCGDAASTAPMDPFLLGCLLYGSALVGAVLCVNRGHSLASVTLLSLLCGPLTLIGALSDRRRTCPQCQNKAHPDSFYCGNCGLQIQPNPPYWLARQQQAAWAPQQGQQGVPGAWPGQPPGAPPSA